MANYDGASAASKAMEIYDDNRDGFIAGEELDKSPGLKAALENLDKNSDGKVSSDEINDRVQAWQSQSLGLMSFQCDVLLDGRELEGATVTLEPEGFLAGTIQEASDVSNSYGTASPRIPKEKRLSPTDPPGVQAGIYKVRISKIVGGKELIPPKFNSETILGQEVSKDDRSIRNKSVIYELTSR